MNLGCKTYMSRNISGSYPCLCNGRHFENKWTGVISLKLFLFRMRLLRTNAHLLIQNLCTFSLFFFVIGEKVTLQKRKKNTHKNSYLFILCNTLLKKQRVYDIFSNNSLRLLNLTGFQLASMKKKTIKVLIFLLLEIFSPFANIYLSISNEERIFCLHIFSKVGGITQAVILLCYEQNFVFTEVL